MEQIYTFHTENPSRRVVVKSNSEEAAKKEFDRMRDAAGLTEESKVVKIDVVDIASNFEDDVSKLNTEDTK